MVSTVSTAAPAVDDTPNQWGPNFGKPAFPAASLEGLTPSATTSIVFGID